MEAAAVTACASIVVAVLAFILNQRSQAAQEQRQVRLARINSQLRELYGPLNALLDVNERVWSAFSDTRLPSRGERIPIQDLPGDAADIWRTWFEKALRPGNLEMRELIIRHADLLIEQDVPQPLGEFCAHVTSYEILVGGKSDSDLPVIRHPGASYVGYVRNSFAYLKREQAKLLESRRAYLALSRS